MTLRFPLKKVENMLITVPKRCLKIRLVKHHRQMKPLLSNKKLSDNYETIFCLIRNTSYGSFQTKNTEIP